MRAWVGASLAVLWAGTACAQDPPQITIRGVPVQPATQVPAVSPSPAAPADGTDHDALPARPVSRTPATGMVRAEADRPEQVVAGLSQDAVSITTDFTGSEILIYGAVKRQSPIPYGPQLGVIVTVEGPSQPVTVRRKERRGGIWINTAGVRIAAAPDLYVVAASGRLATMLDADDDARYRISLPHVVRAIAGKSESVRDIIPFTEALLRLREGQGRYRIDDNKVRLVDQTLFRADVALPSNLVQGTYRTRIFLVRNGRVVDSQTAPIVVEKVGLERWLYRLATREPAVYGLMSLAIAVAAGWGASALFRALRRG